MANGGPDDDRPFSTTPAPYSTTTTSTICHRQQQHNISALMIANRILRKENFMIAFFNQHILNLSIDPKSRHSPPRYFCSSLEVRIRHWTSTYGSIRIPAFISLLWFLSRYNVLLYLMIFKVEHLLLCAEFHVQS